MMMSAAGRSCEKTVPNSSEVIISVVERQHAESLPCSSRDRNCWGTNDNLSFSPVQFAAKDVEELLSIPLSQELHAIFSERTFHSISALKWNAYLSVGCEEALLVSDGHRNCNLGSLLHDNRPMCKRVRRNRSYHQRLHIRSKDWAPCCQRVRSRSGGSRHDQRIGFVVGYAIIVDTELKVRQACGRRLHDHIVQSLAFMHDFSVTDESTVQHRALIKHAAVLNDALQMLVEFRKR